MPEMPWDIPCVCYSFPLMWELSGPVFSNRSSQGRVGMNMLLRFVNDWDDEIVLCDVTWNKMNKKIVFSVRLHVECVRHEYSKGISSQGFGQVMTIPVKSNMNTDFLLGCKCFELNLKGNNNWERSRIFKHSAKQGNTFKLKASVKWKF